MNALWGKYVRINYLQYKVLTINMSSNLFSKDNNCTVVGKLHLVQPEKKNQLK